MKQRNHHRQTINAFSVIMFAFYYSQVQMLIGGAQRPTTDLDLRLGIIIPIIAGLLVLSSVLTRWRLAPLAAWHHRATEQVPEQIQLETNLRRGLEQRTAEIVSTLQRDRYDKALIERALSERHQGRFEQLMGQSRPLAGRSDV